MNDNCEKLQFHFCDIGLLSRKLYISFYNVAKDMGKQKVLPPYWWEHWTVSLILNHHPLEFFIRHHHQRFIGVIYHVIKKIYLIVTNI